jgi:hypothetical protein
VVHQPKYYVVHDAVDNFSAILFCDFEKRIAGGSCKHGATPAYYSRDLILIPNQEMNLLTVASFVNNIMVFTNRFVSRVARRTELKI